MKVLNKYFKAVLSFIAFAVFSFIFAINPSLSTYASLQYVSSDYDAVINAIKMPKKTIDAKQESFDIPLLTGTVLASNYTIRVIDPAGISHDYVPESGSNNYFKEGTDVVSVKSLMEGYYNIIYIATDGDRTFYSNTYKVYVDNVSYELDFTITTGDNKGLKTLLPAKVKTNSNAILLPKGYVKVVGSEETGELVYPVVKKNGAKIEVKESADQGDYYKDGENRYLKPSTQGAYTIEYSSNKGAERPTKTYTIEVEDSFVAPTADDIKISTPNINGIELGKKDITLPSLTVKVNDSSVEYNITSIRIENATKSHIYQVLTNNDRTFDMTKESFEGNPSYKDMVGDYVVTYNIVDAYGNAQTKSAVVSNVTDNTNPKVYMAYDYALNADGSVNGEVNTKYQADLRLKYGYKEIVLPAIYAEDLTTEYNNSGMILYRALRKVGNSEKVYYLDNKKLEDGVLVDVNKGTDGYNYALAENAQPEYNKSITLKMFETDTEAEEKISEVAGEYELIYYVLTSGDDVVKTQENYVYSSGTSQYRITISSDGNYTNETDIPSVKIENMRSSITKNDNEKVNLTITSSDTSDKYLKNVAFRYYGANPVNETRSDVTKTDLEWDIYDAIYDVTHDETSDTYKQLCNVLDDVKFIEKMNLTYTGFEIVSSKDANATNFTVDFANYDSAYGNVAIIGAISLNDNGQIDTDTRIVNLVAVTDDVTPATVNSIVLNDLDEDDHDGIVDVDTLIFNQAETITLPDVTFDNSEELSLDVSYYINSNGNYTEFLPTTGFNYPESNVANTIFNKIEGGTLTTSAAGDYYVVYTATDAAGNVKTLFFTFSVQDSSNPYLTVNATAKEGDTIKKSGNTITAEIGTTIDFERLVYSSDGATDLTDSSVLSYNVESDNLGWSKMGSEFTFKNEGTYTITFSATYNTTTIDPIVIYVNIEKPELEWTKISQNSTPVQTAGTNEEVILPYLTATQGKESAKISVEIKDPNGKTDTCTAEAIEIVENIGGEEIVKSAWKFTTLASVKGTYKITYTAQVGENKITKTFEIKVGDNVKPTIAINNKSKLEKDIVFNGTDIEFNLDLTKTWNKEKLNVIITANGKTNSIETGLNITDITDTNTTPSKLSWSRLNVSLTGNNVSSQGNNKYLITGKGKCTLTLSIKDNYDNERIETIEFNVIEENEVKEENDNVTGIVLIVVSLVVLAGVILFFVFTGKKGGSKSKSTSKRAKNNKSSNEEKIEEVKASEVVVEESNDEQND